MFSIQAITSSNHAEFQRANPSFATLRARRARSARPNSPTPIAQLDSTRLATWAHPARPGLPQPPEVAHLDAELHRLARGAGRLRLRIGQALHRLGDGIHELGFSTWAPTPSNAAAAGVGGQPKAAPSRAVSAIAPAVNRSTRSRLHRLEHGRAPCTACHTSDRSGAPPGRKRQNSSKPCASP